MASGGVLQSLELAQDALEAGQPVGRRRRWAARSRGDRSRAGKRGSSRERRVGGRVRAGGGGQVRTRVGGRWTGAGQVRAHGTEVRERLGAGSSWTGAVRHRGSSIRKGIRRSRESRSREVLVSISHSTGRTRGSVSQVRCSPGRGGRTAEVR